jgi:hypothetical protein
MSGGTLEIGGTFALAGGQTFFTWGNGYVHPGSALPVEYPLAGTIQLAASGATVMVAVLRGRSPGF